ncbi:hypothetical protein B0181_00445 [Moraxella caviae]|nr:hypothetical protein [Moraxella caviae]OOR93446.1 hypothetical protein B0181_00445 [Moraxella caviae]
MLDITKLQHDIELSRQTVEATRQSVNESYATVEKMRKETAWFPYLQIITTLATGSVIAYLLGKFIG